MNNSCFCRMTESGARNTEGSLSCTDLSLQRHTSILVLIKTAHWKAVVKWVLYLLANVSSCAFNGIIYRKKLSGRKRKRCEHDTDIRCKGHRSLATMRKTRISGYYFDVIEWWTQARWRRHLNAEFSTSFPVSRVTSRAPGMIQITHHFRVSNCAACRPVGLAACGAAYRVVLGVSQRSYCRQLPRLLLLLGWWWNWWWWCWVAHAPPLSSVDRTNTCSSDVFHATLSIVTSEEPMAIEKETLPSFSQRANRSFV